MAAQDQNTFPVRTLRTMQRRFTSLVRVARSPNVTPPRFLNFILSKVSYRTRSTKNLSLPNTLYIEATSTCNLHCAICPTGIGTLGRPKAHMSLASFKQIVDQASGSLLRIVWAGYGEPFINAATYEMISYARSRKIFTEVYSNLLLLDDDELRKLVHTGLDLLVVAVDFAPEGKNWRYVYKTERDIDKVKNRLRRLAEIKREQGSNLPVIRVSYPVTKDNEAFLGEVKAFAAEIDAEFLPKTVNAVVAGEDPEQMQDKWVADAFSRYKRPKVGSGHCSWPYVGGLIYANGDVSPCCHLGRGEHNLGNVFKDGVGGVWNGPKYVEFRRRLMLAPETLEHCANCTERFGTI